MQIYHQNSNVFSCFNGPFAAERSHGTESPNGRANENKENSSVEKLILLYNLGASTTEKNCLTTREKWWQLFTFLRSAGDMSLALFSAINEW